MSTMESRFAHLRQRDSSVSMLRVKMSRRRSQSQKENRERVMNCRRQLDNLPELESSCLDASIMTVNMSTVENKAPNNAKYVAATERMKQLERWKERKALEKEKEKREKERKGVFKTGLYQPKDTLAFGSLPPVPAAIARAKEVKMKTVQATRITRSMKQQQQQAQKPQKEQDRSIVMKKVEPVVERLTRSRVAVHPLPAPALTRNKASTEPAVRALSTRSANRPPVAAVPLGKDQSKPKEKSAAEARVTRARTNVKPAVPPSGREKNCKVQPAGPKEPEVKEPEQKARPASPIACEDEEERMMVDQAPAESVPSLDPTAPPCSFAPQGFVFQAPAGLSSFRFEPLTPRSADSFLTPSSSFNLPSVPPPCFDFEPQADLSGPPAPKSPHHSPPLPSPTPASQTTTSPQEPQHDVPYFRSEVTNETERLMSLCAHWESKVEDESIPEEMRDRMRTVVGQARLLMKERFNQFSGLVDDCELGRGEKITTCTDLQGFWDMVYYQVEDVHKKFDALKEAEARGWVEEHKPPPRQRRAVKKPPSATAAKPAGSSAAAKSRLAAVKAAMKARQQAAEAEKAAKVAVISEDGPDPGPQDQQPPALAPPPDTVVFNGGFFQIESPAKLSGSVRRSSRLSAAVLPQASPCSSLTLTPGKITRRSTALSHASPAHLAHTPARLRQSPQPNTPQLSHNRRDNVNVSLSFSPVKEVSSDSMQPEEHPENQLESATRQGETTLDCNEDTNQPEHFTVPEPSSPVREQSLPTISVVQDQDGAPETTSASLPLSPFKSSSASSHVPTSPSTLRLTLSPCLANSQSPLSSPTVCSSPPAVQSPVEDHESRRSSPDSSVNESVPGLDFERYFQPSQRLSLSLRDTVSSELLSPMAVDIEMESPTAQRGDLQTQEEEIMMPTTLPGASRLTPQTHQAQTAESHLLLFTPDLKDRIRQSVCPSDLMVFTPPFNQ
ncbi:disks large-associated protein 5 isoform X1 [Myripristis murdjan]|uniref:Discs, large (Drosophila) homolog-associated protein 5 n=1 Tax=Myripristis murdjan TaxID=586833 RepID=A0A668AC90_9TELE|nr:disks large-associated protein 5 isoform X1 [Myripristis murdjan]